MMDVNMQMYEIFTILFRLSIPIYPKLSFLLKTWGEQFEIQYNRFPSREKLY